MSARSAFGGCRLHGVRLQFSERPHFADFCSHHRSSAMPLDKPAVHFTPIKLPYAENALEPVISAKTVSFHYGKHHKAYVDKLNELIEGTAYAGMSLEDIVKKSAKDEKGKAIFNNAAQAWNHDFYWHSMAPKGGAPAGKIKKALEDSFGGVEDFNKAFKAAAVGQFGSG